MTVHRYFALLRREARGTAGRLVFFVACLAVGVAAVVAVAGLSAGLDEGLRREARQLLAADLAIKSRRPAPPELEKVLAGATPRGTVLRRAEIRELATVVAAPAGPSQLVELKAVRGPYPFYGDLELEPELEPDRPLGELLGADTAVVEPGLLTRLGLAVGDVLRIGGADFRIRGTVLSEPDRVRFGLTLGPRVFVSFEGLDRAALVRKGSRVEHKVLLQVRGGPAATDAEALQRLADRLQRELPLGFGVETWREAQPSLRAGLRRLDRFLGLVALLSLLVGGVGVAQTVRSWLADRMDSIAILKCLGLRPREITALYLGQAALLGLAGSVVGLAGGVAVLLVLPEIFPQLIPRALLVPWQPAALGRGLVLGVGVALLFSAPPLLTVRRVPSARVLRRDAEPLPARRGVLLTVGLALAGGVFAIAAVQSGSVPSALRFVGGLAAVGISLAVAAVGLILLVGRLHRHGSTRGSSPRGFGLRGFLLRSFVLRHGLAALGRPGAGTLGAVVALGLGVLVVVAVAVVERQLADQLTAHLPREAPSAFLVDIQPDQWPEVRDLLLAEGGRDLDSVPVVTARLAAIDGEGVESLARETSRRNPEDRSRRWALTREQRLTYRPELPSDNRVVAGRLWAFPDRAEVSVEEGYAEELGVDLGTVLTLDVQGVSVELTVSSLRAVDWSTFRLNFFLLVEPGVLEAAPRQRVATVRLPEETGAGKDDPLQRVQDRLAARFPNVTFLRVEEIVEKVVAVLRRISLGVRFVGGFTVLAGLVILGGAVSAGSARRGREVALLKTLGVTRRGVAGIFAVEYALVGLVAGAVGAVGGGVLAREVVRRGLDLPWSFDPGPFLVAVVGSALLTVVAGLAASARALSRRPLEVLRESP